MSVKILYSRIYFLCEKFYFSVIIGLDVVMLLIRLMYSIFLSQSTLPLGFPILQDIYIFVWEIYESWLTVIKNYVRKIQLSISVYELRK